MNCCTRPPNPVIGLRVPRPTKRKIHTHTQTHLHPPTTTTTTSPSTTMASRPTVSIATADGKPSGATQPLPAVFTAPIRPDIVQYVDTSFADFEALTAVQAGSHWHGEEQEAAVCREPACWRADLCRVLGYWYVIWQGESKREWILMITGRAVARIPRVSGGGTHRAGQAAFGNQCRSGRMFAPTKVWRKWHAKINVGQRYARNAAII